MTRNEILLSGGSVPWLGLQQTIHLAKSTGFDGIELVPTRKITSELMLIVKKDKNIIHSLPELKYVKGLHQSWRLDIGNDKKYGLPLLVIPLFLTIRLLFFPEIKYSRRCIGFLSKTLNIPVTVHGISRKWTLDEKNKEFAGEILYELIGDYAENPDKIKKWLKEKNHYVVVDTRDDQSLKWARKYGLNDWRTLWTWIGLEKIKSIQLTLIGPKGLSRILNKQYSLAEEQFLWLHAQDWKGSVTVEVNPLTLFLLYKGRLKKGLQEIALFIRKTLNEGKKWF